MAHPVDLGVYDRTIDIHLSRERITVRYHLELSEQTACLDLDRTDHEEAIRLAKREEYHEAFLRVFAPILADRLTARLDGKALELTCVRRSLQAKDHLYCEFVFEAPWDLQSGRSHQFTFRDDTYSREAGSVHLTLAADSSVRLVAKTEPDKALKSRSFADLNAEEELRLRSASATIEATTADVEPPPEPPAPSTEGRPGDGGLLQLFLDSERGFWVLMALAVGLGAAHALTPGHGKTLVAAYLVGQRGTVWHALLLGLITTLTHTGVVLLLAVGLRIWFPHGLTAETQRRVDTILGLTGGALIAGLGAWLLFRRLAGQADHFHLPGHGHHHHHHHDHDHADHYHDEHGHAHPLPADGGAWGLVVLGIQGGIVPCWDAVVLLLLAVARNQLGLALPLLLAFSAGLASVLIAIGIVVVKAHGLAGARWGGSRLFRALPLVSAAVITVLGLWLCYDHLHPASPPPPAHTRP